jgi:Tfp pilus assembly protein PilO
MRTMQSQIVWCWRMQKTLAVICCLVLLTFCFAVYRPATAELLALKQSTIKREQQLKANQLSAAARNEIAARNERLRAELDRIKKPSKQQELPDLIKELSLFGQQASLKKFVNKPSLPIKGDLYCEMPLSLTFEGDFVNIFNFIRSTEEMHRLTRVRSISLKSKDLTGSKVQATVALNIYYSAE